VAGAGLEPGTSRSHDYTFMGLYINWDNTADITFFVLIPHFSTFARQRQNARRF